MTTKREPTTVPFRSVHYTAAGSMAKPPPEKWLIPAFALKGSPTFLWGSRHPAKSYLATYFAMCVAIGDDFLTIPTRKSNVLYADWDSDEDAFHDRCLEISRGMGLGAIEDGRLVGVDGLRYRKARGPLHKAVGELAEQIAEEDIGLIIIDSLHASGRGKGTLPKYAEELRNLSCPTLVIHHIDKRQLDEHHSPYYMLCRSAWYVEACPGEFNEQGHHEPTMFLKLQHERHSHSARQGDMYLRLSWDGAASAPSEQRLSIDRVSAETFRREQPLDIDEVRILEYIRSVGRPCGRPELMEALGPGVRADKLRRVTGSLVDKVKLVWVDIPDGAGPGKLMGGCDLAERQREEE